VIRLFTILCVGFLSIGANVFSAIGAEPGTKDPSPTAKMTSPTVITSLTLTGDERQTRLVIELDRKIDFRVFTLADPYRVVIDLTQVIFKLPPNAGEQGRGLVKAFRFGLMMQGGSRIVIDTEGPVKVDQAFGFDTPSRLDTTDAQPSKLIIDLVPTDRQSFIASEDRSGEGRSAHATAPRIEEIAKDENDLRPLIVLDPGHGGIDTGTKGLDGQNEKDIVLVFARTLRDQLVNTGKYRVAMTRSDDIFIPLNERVRFARNRKAALFISIHADSVPRRQGQAEGASVYTLSEEASDAEAAAIAEAENKSDALAGIDLSAEPNDVANILVDLAQRETKTFSLQFARSLTNELKTTVRLHKHPLKSAGFVVLKAPDVPSVLIELGYMSTRDDLKFLMSSAWQDRTATAVVRSINAYLGPRRVPPI
jgi:N-acetylmuramoyl-L-alanine amidase